MADQPFDILAALEATPQRGSSRCPLFRFLDAIPADTAGREELIRLVETPHDPKRPKDGPQTRAAENMAVVLTNLGFPTGDSPIRAHRNHACRCYR